MKSELIQKVNIIRQFREKMIQNDSPELQKKRSDFLGWLYCRSLVIPKVLEMYQGNEKTGTIYGNRSIAQYLHEYYLANTRTQIPTETHAEIDKLPSKEAVEIICSICLSLINNGFSFYVFYAEGQRSPHIIIYDFAQLEKLNPYQRTKARAKFWRMIAPFQIHLLDQSLWDDDHYVPLEYSPHWKYGTPFKLLFKYTLEEQNATAP